MKAVIFSGAQISDYSFCSKYVEKTDIVICCDSGLTHAKALNIIPDYIVGDFDSVPEGLLDEYKSLGVKIKKYPAKKDVTDTYIGTELAISLGADDIVLLGALGGRLDHTLANIELLYFIWQRGAKGELSDERNSIRLVSGEALIEGEKGDTISILPFDKKASGITTEGLFYPLLNGKLEKGGSVSGVSNVMAGKTASVKVEDGIIYIIRSRE